MTARLKTVAQDLAEMVERGDEACCRRAAVAVAEFAATHSGLDDPRAEALFAIRDGRLGDTPERAAVEAVAEALDDRQWDVQDRVGTGETTAEEHLLAFGRARAASAIFYAGDINPRVAASEAIYEASAVIDDLNELRAVVVPALS
jgi:hypothetical protein